MKKEKEIHKVIATATPADAKTCSCFEHPLSQTATEAFRWMQDCYKKDIPIASESRKREVVT